MRRFASRDRIQRPSLSLAHARYTFHSTLSGDTIRPRRLQRFSAAVDKGGGLLDKGFGLTLYTFAGHGAAIMSLAREAVKR